jgi:predicted transcriptional regulator
VKIAVQKVGEVGLNFNVDDLLAAYTAGDAMDHPQVFNRQARIRDVLKVASESEESTFAIIDENKKVLGVITLDQLKRCFADMAMNEWLLAVDVMQENTFKVKESMALADAVEGMRRRDLESIPVIAADSANEEYRGMLDLRAVNKKINRELERRRQLADGL